MIQEARPRLVDFYVAAALDSFPVIWNLPLDYFRYLLRLGICLFSLGCSGRFLRLEIFIFFLELLKVFRIF